MNIDVWPPPRNSDHQDYDMFWFGDSYKSSFATATGRRPHPKIDRYKYVCIDIRCMWYVYAYDIDSI